MRKSNVFTDKDYKEARMVGVKAHSNQSYDEVFPYEKHLDDVVDILKRFGFAGIYIIAVNNNQFGMKIYTVRKNGLPVWKIKIDFKWWVSKLLKKK